MPTTPNGWRVDGPRMTRTVPGTKVSLTVAAGPVGEILLWVAEQFHNRVERIDGVKDDGGFSVRRNVNNPSKWSEHAAGAAIDLNATEHPNGKRNTFTKSQYAEIKKILDQVDNVVRNLPYDEMHFEVRRVPLAKVKAALDKVTGTVVVPVAHTMPASRETLRKGSTGDDVKLVQRFLGLTDDGVFGPVTYSRVRYYQRLRGLEPDGIVGSATWASIESGLNPSGGDNGGVRGDSG